MQNKKFANYPLQFGRYVKHFNNIHWNIDKTNNRKGERQGGCRVNSPKVICPKFLMLIDYPEKLDTFNLHALNMQKRHWRARSARHNAAQRRLKHLPRTRGERWSNSAGAKRPRSLLVNKYKTRFKVSLTLFLPLIFFLFVALQNSQIQIWLNFHKWQSIQFPIFYTKSFFDWNFASYIFLTLKIK